MNRRPWKPWWNSWPTSGPRKNRNLGMEIKRGTPVFPGVVIGPALVLDTEGFRIPLRFVDKKERAGEIERLHRALAAAGQDARDNQQAISDKLGKKYGAIFSGHAAL